MNVYFDNAATTPMRKEVIDSISSVMNDSFGNPSSTHAFGRNAKKYVETARKEIASLLNASPQEIIFTSGVSYQSKAQQASGIRDEFDNRLWFPNRIILGESFNFYVVNKTILDENGDYTFMDLVAQDYTDSSSVYDGEFNIANDRILVGQTDSLGNWEGTAFLIDFRKFSLIPSN